MSPPHPPKSAARGREHPGRRTRKPENRSQRRTVLGNVSSRTVSKVWDESRKTSMMRKSLRAAVPGNGGLQEGRAEVKLQPGGRKRPTQSDVRRCWTPCSPCCY